MACNRLTRSVLFRGRHFALPGDAGRGLLAWVCAAVLAGGLMPAIGFAQDAVSSQPSTQPAGAADMAGSELKVETIEARIREVEAATGMAEAVRTELLSLYRQTLDQLKITATWAAEADRLEQRRQQIPGEITELKALLERTSSQPATQPVLSVSPDATREELRRGLEDAEAELTIRRQALSASENDIRAWSERRTSRPQKIADVNSQLEEVNVQLSGLPVAGVDADVVTARRTFLLARRRALEQEIGAYEQELRGYDAVGNELLTARHDVARLEVARAEALVAAWGEAVGQKREALIDQQRQEAERQLAQAPRAIHEVAEASRGLVEERKDVDGKINETTAKAKAAEAILARLNDEFELLQAKARTAGMAAYLGPLLYKQREQLPDMTSLERDIRAVNRAITHAQLRAVELDEQRAELGDLEEQVRAFLDAMRASQDQVDLTEIEPQVRSVLRSRVEAIESLKKDYEVYWNELVTLSIAQNRLLTKRQAVLEFINERVFWLPSNRPLLRAKLPERLGPPAGAWSTIRGAILLDVVRHRAGYGAAVLLAVAWLAAYPRIRKRRTAIDQRALHVYTDSFGLTVQALLIDLFLAIPVPVAIALLGSRLYWTVSPDNPRAYDFVLAISQAMRDTALPLFIVLFLLSLFRAGGLAESHFQWSSRLTKVLRRNLVWLAFAGVSLAFLLRFGNAHADESWNDSIGRAMYVALAALLAFFAHRVLHPRYGVLAPAEQVETSGRVPPIRVFWYIVGLAVPVALLAASAVGYHATAIMLTQTIARSLYLVAGLLALRAVIVRAIVLSARRMAMRKAAEEHGAVVEESGQSQGAMVPARAAIGRPVQELDERSRALLRWMIMFGLAVGLWGIWQEIVPALGVTHRIRLWSYTVATPAVVALGQAESTASQAGLTIVPVHLGDLLLALILAAATVILATNGPSMVEILLLTRLPIDPGARFAIAAILRYIILVVGLVLAFGMIGIKWSQVQWLAAAITVGLGFGLQEIFANFVSGLILLFERPVRIGDTVTVGDISGTVSRIQIRATTILGWDRKELIIPNREFVTGKVINWTLSDSTLRVLIEVGIAYGSDTRLAERLLQKVAAEHPLVLDDPPPVVVFWAFGESSLNFELRVYVGRADQFLTVRHELHQGINDVFREAGIEIAFPQRDIRIRSTSKELPATHARLDAGSAAGNESKNAGEARSQGD